MADRNYILQIVLRARDETSAAIASAIAKLEALQKAQEKQRLESEKAARSSQSQTASSKQADAALASLGFKTLDAARAQRDLENAMDRVVSMQARNKSGTVEFAEARRELATRENDFSKALVEHEGVEQRLANTTAKRVRIDFERNARQREEEQILQRLHDLAGKIPDIEPGNPEKIAKVTEEIEKLRGSLGELYKDARQGDASVTQAIERFKTARTNEMKRVEEEIVRRTEENRKTADAIYATFSEQTQQQFREADIPRKPQVAQILQRSIAPAYQAANPAADQAREARATGDLRRAREQLIQAGLSEEQAEKALHAVRAQALRDYGFENTAAREASRSQRDATQALRAQRNETEAITEAMRKAEAPAHALANISSTQPQELAAKRQLASITENLSRSLDDEVRARRIVNSVQLEALNRHDHESQEARDLVQANRAQVLAYEEVEKAQRKVINTSRQYENATRSFRQGRTRQAPVAPVTDDETIQKAATDIGQGGVTMGQTGANVDGLAAKLQGLSRTFANLDTSTQGFDQSLRNAFGFSAVALIQPLITLLMGLAGTFAAVGSAAVAAGGALGATFASGIAQGIPVVGLFAAAMQRLQTVFGYVQAQQQQQQQSFIAQYQTARMNAMGINQVAIAQHDYSNALYAQQQAIRQVGVAEHDYQNAIYSRQQAVRGITIAEHSYSDAIYSTRIAEINVKNAEFSLLQTRQQATRQLQDLILQEESAKLAAEASSLAVTDAQKALANAVATGGDVRASQLQLQQAQLGHTQAVNQAQRAIADATPGSITRQGISQQVQQAQLGVESARRAVVDAQFAQAQAQQGILQARHAVVDADYALVSARQGIIQAQRAVIDSQFQVAQARAAIVLAQQAAAGYNLATAAQLAWLRSQMTQTELSLANNITRIYDLFRGVHGYMRPITDAILAPFVTLTNQIYNTLRDPRMFNALNYLGQQMGAALNQLFIAAFRPDVLNNFRTIIRQAADNMRPLATIAVNMLSGIQTIIVQAGPYVHQFLLFIGQIARQFNTWAQSVRGKTWLKDFFDLAFPSLEAFVNAGIAILRLIAAVVVTGNGAKTGIGVIRDFTNWLNRLTDQINNHGKAWRDLQRLWTTVQPALGALKEILGALVQGLLQIGGSKSGRDNLKAVADIVAYYLIPAFVQFIQITGTVIGMIVKFLDKHPAVASMLKDMLGFALAWTILRRGLGLIFGPLAGLLDIAGHVIHAFDKIKNYNWAGSTIGRFGRSAKDALAPILSPIATAVLHPIQTARRAGGAIARRLPGRGGLGAARVAQVGEYGAGAAEAGAEGAGAATATTGAAGGGGIASTLGAVAVPAAGVAAAIVGIAAATGNLRKLWNAVKAPFVSFWNEIRKPLRELSKDFSYFVDSFSHAKGPVSTALHVIGAVFSWLWRLIKGGVGSVLDSFKDILGTIGHVLGKLAGDALKILGDVFRLLGDIIRGRWGRVWKDIKKLFGDFLGWFWDALKSIPQLVLGVLKSMWNRTWEFFGTTGKKVWSWATGVGKSIIDGIGSFVSGLWRHLVKWFWDAVHAVESFLGISSPSKTFWNMGWNMIMGLLHGLESVGNGILDFGKKIVDWIVNGIKSAPGKIKDAIVGIIPKSVRGILSHVPLVGGLFKAKGGPIDPGGYGGGDRHITVLESGEHVLTKEEVRSAGGHEGVYAYRRSLGGGGQSRERGMQQGGAAGAVPITNADFLTVPPQTTHTGQTTNTEGVTGALGGSLQNILNFRKRFTTGWQDMWTQVGTVTKNNSRSTQIQFKRLEDSIVSIWNKLSDKSVSFWKGIQDQSAYYSGQILNQITKSLNQAHAKAAHMTLGGILHFSAGGIVGQMGERGRDTVHAVLGRGEAVLNNTHQKYVNPALNKAYGWTGGLRDLYSKVKGQHGVGRPEQEESANPFIRKSQRMASGGYAQDESGVIRKRERHPLGRAVSIVAHAGEWVVNEAQQSKLAKKFNTSVSAIRETLFSTREEKSSKTHYQAGGPVGGFSGVTTAGWTSTTGAFQMPAAVDLNIPGWSARALWQYNWTQHQITTRIERNGASLAKGIQQFLANYALVGGDNGLFAQAATAIDNFTSNLNNRIAYLASGVRQVKGGELRFGRADTAVQQAFRQQWASIQEGDWLHELQIQEVDALKSVNQQLSRLGGPTRSNMGIWQQLMGARQDLANKLRDTDQKLAQNLEDQYQNAVNLFQAQLAQNLRGMNTLTGHEIGAVTGKFALGTGQGIINGFRNLRDVLAKVGPNVALGIAQMAQTVAQAAGNITQTLMADKGVLAAARGQQRALQSAYDRAAEQARTDPRWQSVADDLLGQLESSTEQVVQAQQQAFQDRMAAIQQRIQAAPQAQSGFLQAAQGITQTLGQISGSQNLPTLIQYAQQNTASLANQGQDIISGIRQALSGRGDNAMFGSNQGQAQNILGQLVQAFQQGPQDFANVLSSMGPKLANFEAHLPATQQTLFQNLVQALIDNTTATVNNSQNLQQLQATTNQQDFASSAWSQLRQAIFSGMGQLLPQYAMTVPSADVGAIITQEGILHGHRGEAILPAEISRPLVGHPAAPIHKHIESHTHITSPTEVADPVYLGNRIAFNIGQMPNER